jgi:hypothetical protein
MASITHVSTFDHVAKTLVEDPERLVGDADLVVRTKGPVTVVTSGRLLVCGPLSDYRIIGGKKTRRACPARHMNRTIEEDFFQAEIG